MVSTLVKQHLTHIIKQKTNILETFSVSPLSATILKWSEETQFMFLYQNIKLKYVNYNLFHVVLN